VDKSEVLRIICDYGKALEAEGVKPQRIILFGSYRAGTRHEGTDIDLVVISEDFADKDCWGRIDILAAAMVKVFQPIEAVAMTPEEWKSGDSLIADYARNGEVV
jgi:predicted nucleotidyltransferase